MHHDELRRRYGRDEYYWGTEPNEFATRALSHAPDRDELTVVDVGAGEGRDAVFFAAEGADVTAIDPIPEGLEKAEALAADRDVAIETREGDVNDLDLARPVDLFYSIGTLQYLRPKNRAAQFEAFKRGTTPGGVHAVWAFVDANLPPAPDWGGNEHLYDEGELRSYYENWEVLFEDAYVFDDESDGVPHRHAAEEYVFEKPS